MGGAGGVADGALDVAAVLLDEADGGLHVAEVVEGVEDAEDVHAVLDGEADELLEDVISVVAVGDDVLAAEEHLEAGVLDAGAELAEAVPRVLVEEADAGIVGGAAPDLKGEEADLIELLGNGQHIPGAHARGNQRLMAVPKR